MTFWLVEWRTKMVFMLRGINVGELDTRITFQKSSVSNHAVTNEEVKTWSDVKSVWAKELGPISQEGTEYNQQVAVEETRFFVRASVVFSIVTADSTLITADNATITADNFYGVAKVVDEKMRLLRKGEIFHINSIEGSRRRGFAIVKAVKRDNG